MNVFQHCHRSFFVIGTSVLVFIILLLIFCSSVLFLNNKRNSRLINESTVFNKYKYLELNPKTNERSVGFVTIPEELGGNEFIHYEDERTRNHILISQFFDPYDEDSDCFEEEYECSGSCVCQIEESSTRRSISTTSLSRGLKYLLVSVSTLIAFEKSEKYFQEKCSSEFEDISCTSIKSSVDNCVSFETFSSPQIAGHHFQKKQVGGGRKIGKYWCEGTCTKKQYQRNSLASLQFDHQQQQDDAVNCKEMKASGPVSVDITDLTPCEIKSSMESLIHAKFRAEILGPYCKRESMFDYEYFFEKEEEEQQQQQVKRRRKNIPICSSSINGYNPSISCVAKTVVVQGIQILDGL